MSESLSLWPQGFEDLITEKLAAFRDRFGEAVALFDADETLWHGDIVEAHYALMEVVRRHDAYNFEGHPTVEHKADESMVAYYQRLYDAQGVTLDLNGPAMCTAVIRSRISSVRQGCSSTKSDKTSTTFPTLARSSTKHSGSYSPGSKPTT